jgi:hypothetical protein
MFGKMAHFFAWNGAMLAYQEGWYDTALAVCDRWEDHVVRHYGDPGYIPVRIACYLSQGQYEQAEALLPQLRKKTFLVEEAAGNYGWNWKERLQPLLDAVKAKDKTSATSLGAGRGRLSC